jgi:hypothetical protein
LAIAGPAASAMQILGLGNQNKWSADGRYEGNMKGFRAFALFFRSFHATRRHASGNERKAKSKMTPPARFAFRLSRK